jgi:hypothetical protein
MGLSGDRRPFFFGVGKKPSNSRDSRMLLLLIV